MLHECRLDNDYASVRDIPTWLHNARTGCTFGWTNKRNRDTHTDCRARLLLRRGDHVYCYVDGGVSKTYLQCEMGLDPSLWAPLPLRWQLNGTWCVGVRILEPRVSEFECEPCSHSVQSLAHIPRGSCAAYAPSKRETLRWRLRVASVID